MSTKTKNETVIDKINDTAMQAGVVLMTAAVTLGLVDVPQTNKPDKRVVLPANKPAFAFAGENEELNPIRREREETGPHYVSYAVNQRTPGRTGKI
jgi:hypothetical protein